MKNNQLVQTNLKAISTYINRVISPKYDENEGFIVLNQKCIRDGRININFSKKTRADKNYNNEKKLQYGDILINSTGVGTAGRVSIFEESVDCYVDTHISILRIDNKYCDPKFIFYNLFRRQDELENYAEGSTGQIELSRTRIGDVEICLPSLDKQKSIAKILTSLDDKINLLQIQNETLEKLTETLYRQKFIEEARKDWEVGVLSDLIIVKYGKDHKKLKEGNIPVYGSGGLMRHVDTSLYQEESVLIPRKGSLNNVIYLDIPFWTVDTMFYTVMKRDNLAKFIYYFIKDKDLAAMNVGSAVPSMTTDILNNMPIVIPPEELLSEFNRIARPMFNKIKSNHEQIKTLINMRDCLLPKLMNGEIRIK